MTYRANIRGRTTPQSEAMTGKDQVQNDAGGYVFQLDKWKMLDRFLILGAEGGTYYVNQQTLVARDVSAARECIKEDGKRVVQRVVEISQAGRAPKNEPALLVLAMCTNKDIADEETRKLAYQELGKVARIGTHLFHFCAYADEIRGWSRGLRKAVARWYEEKPLEDLGYQAIKYRQRDGWTHADVMMLSHPKTLDEERNRLFRWMADKRKDINPVEAQYEGNIEQVDAYEALASSDAASNGKVWENRKARESAARTIVDNNLPWEAIPTRLHKYPEIWEALLPSMGMTAMIRQLARMTNIGVLTPVSNATRHVVEQLGNEDLLRRQRVHPLKVLAALATYRRGYGVKGSLVWEPVGSILDALDKAFYLAFGNVEGTGKRIQLALDVSGSMEGYEVAGVGGVSAREASAAMALVTMASESNCYVTGFTCDGSNAIEFKGSRYGYGDGLSMLPITPRQRLDDVVSTVRGMRMGGTDCSLPMLYAAEKKIPTDTFIVYTDNETWAGKIHPVEALEKYRRESGIDAQLIVVGMTATEFSIADPNDAGMLDVVGFDTATPEIISRFMRGEI